MPEKCTRVLLVQPAWSSVHGSFAEIATSKLFLPPVGLCYLAAALSREDCEVRILDSEAEGLTRRQEMDAIAACAPDLLGVTATTPAYHLAKRFCEDVKGEFPELPVVIGGPHVTGTGGEGLGPAFDYAILGEGEASILLLVKAVRGEIDFESVPDLVYRVGGALRFVSRSSFIQDLDSIPFPKRDLLKQNLYKTEVPGRGVQRCTTITASRGCPFQCIFCAARSIHGKIFRMRSVENILREIDDIRNRFGIPHLYFNDSTLTLKRECIMQLCEGLRKNKLDVTWEGMTRVNMIDKELLREMKKSGFVRLALGIESGDQRILDIMKKGVTLEEIREAYRMCREAGIQTESFAMLGLPGETRETIRRTAWFVRSIPEVRYSSFSIATPYPGTELLEMAKGVQHGLKLLSTDYSKYRRYDGGVMEVNGLSPEDLQTEQKRGLLIMHLAPRKMLALIRHFGIRVLATKFVAILADILGRHNGKPEIK
jgi:anaerobic magnesium-protoporphyrin IX monomethyl ester cyclase